MARRYGMVIDLARCIGCHACTQACRAENRLTPGVLWNRVEQVETGEFPRVRRLFVPIHCMHCGDPECLRVCPTGATSQRADGLVLVDHERCIGCKSCMVACPYEVRRQNWGGSYFPEGPTPWEARGRAAAPPRAEGTVEKCTFCVHRLDRGLEPACVATCITGAIRVGDLGDPASEVSRVIRDRGAVQIKPFPDADPSVYYLGAEEVATLFDRQETEA